MPPGRGRGNTGDWKIRVRVILALRIRVTVRVRCVFEPSMTTGIEPGRERFCFYLRPWLARPKSLIG